MTKSSAAPLSCNSPPATAGLLGSGYLDRLAAQQPCADGAAAGTLIETLPLSRDDGVVQPFAVKFGGPGLDARQVTDLAHLEPDRLITPNHSRSSAPSAPPPSPGGRVRGPSPPPVSWRSQGR